MVASIHKLRNFTSGEPTRSRQSWHAPLQFPFHTDEFADTALLGEFQCHFGLRAAQHVETEGSSVTNGREELRVAIE